MRVRMPVLLIALTAVAHVLTMHPGDDTAVAATVQAAETIIHAGPASSPRLSQRSIYLAFLGDTGTGNDRQRRVRDQLLSVSRNVSLQSVFLLGDNLYNNGESKHIMPRFVTMYEDVMATGATFHTALGNHDVKKCKGAGVAPVPRDHSVYRSASNCWVAEQLARPEFGYPNGYRYYSVTSGGTPPLTEVFVLDSNTLSADGVTDGSDGPQLDWLRNALSRSTAVWKIVAMHHPIYSPRSDRFLWAGRDAEDDLRALLEPILADRVDVVFQGHNHMYARLEPQNGVRYFVSGAGGQKPYKFQPDAMTIPRSDRGQFNHFVAVRATDEVFEYCVIDDSGATRDGGWFRAGDATDTTFAPGSCAILEAPRGMPEPTVPRRKGFETLSFRPSPVGRSHRQAATTSPTLESS